MIVLELFDLKKYVGDRLILELPRLTVYTGDKIGIVGQNGACWPERPSRRKGACGAYARFRICVSFLRNNPPPGQSDGFCRVTAFHMNA